MDTDTYRAAYEGRIGADRMEAGLSCIPNKIHGDLDEVLKLRIALESIKMILKGPAANRRLMAIAGPARQCLNIIKSVEPFNYEKDIR